MSPRHFFPSALLLAAGLGFTLADSPTAAAQDRNEPPKKPGTYSSVALTYKPSKTIPPDQQPAAEVVFTDFAKWFKDYVKYPRLYTFPQEFLPDPPPRSALPLPLSMDDLIKELSKHILVPTPFSIEVYGRATGSDNADYIQLLGKALDAQFKEVIQDQGADRIVRVNATRLLAAACRSGATAHYETVIDILDDTVDRFTPEVKYYALQAAGNLLAAYDVAELPARTRAYQSRRHTGSDAAVGRLIEVLMHAVENPDRLVFPPPAKGAKPAPRTKEQNDVLAFFRREAVRALGQVRFAVFALPQQGKPHKILFPAHTLARIALADPALALRDPPETTDPKKETAEQKTRREERNRLLRARRSAEAAEAVIGFCNMSPTSRLPADVPDPEYQPAAAAEIVAAGIIDWISPRAGNPKDTSLPWRGYAARVGEAIRRWPPFFDPSFPQFKLADSNFDPDKPDPRAKVYEPKSVPDSVRNLVKTARDAIIDKLDGTSGGTPSTQALRDHVRKELRGDAAGKPLVLFRNRPELAIPRPPL